MAALRSGCRVGRPNSSVMAGSLTRQAFTSTAIGTALGGPRIHATPSARELIPSVRSTSALESQRRDTWRLRPSALPTRGSASNSGKS